MDDPTVLHALKQYNQKQCGSHSIRCLNYFVVNYCKEVLVEIQGKNLYHMYQTQLRYYRRRDFDPFRRGAKLDYGKGLWTTTAQINFFAWAVRQGVLQYFERHHKTISVHMNQKIKKEDTKQSCRQYICGINHKNLFKVNSIQPCSYQLHEL